jgi:RNA polymerase sigma-B factor
MSSNAAGTHRAHRREHDAPETAADFERLAALPAGPERNRLVEELVQAWLPMAHRLARRFRNRGETIEVLEQVAALGLVKAVDRYRPGWGDSSRTLPPCPSASVASFACGSSST